ncbi:MAG: RuBisCO large subunit C-terminal-like domain-containing protein [Syntrophomonadaceae bacterium]
MGALPEKFLRTYHVGISPFYHIKPALNLVGGGVTPGMVPYLMDQLGNDFIVGVGAAIHGHPMGPRAGAVAFRAAIDAVMKGIDIRTAAEDCPELQKAVDIWGIFGVDDYSKLYDIES